MKEKNGNENPTKQKVYWVEQWPGTCVKNLCTFLCRPLQNQQRKMNEFCVFWRTEVGMANFSYFFLELIADITYLVWANFKYWLAYGADIQIATRLQILFCVIRSRPWRGCCLLLKLPIFLSTTLNSFFHAWETEFFAGSF